MCLRAITDNWAAQNPSTTHLPWRGHGSVTYLYIMQIQLIYSALLPRTQLQGRQGQSYTQHHQLPKPPARSSSAMLDTV